MSSDQLLSTSEVKKLREAKGFVWKHTDSLCLRIRVELFPIPQAVSLWLSPSMLHPDLHLAILASSTMPVSTLQWEPAVPCHACYFCKAAEHFCPCVWLGPCLYWTMGLLGMTASGAKLLLLL